MRSWVATDPDFDDKVAYSTLSRTLGPFSKLAVFLLEVFQQYNWKRVIVISSNYLLYWDAGKAVRKTFSESNITVAYTSDFNRFPSDTYIRNTLYRTSLEGRSTFFHHSYVRALNLFVKYRNQSEISNVRRKQSRYLANTTDIIILGAHPFLQRFA